MLQHRQHRQRKQQQALQAQQKPQQQQQEEETQQCCIPSPHSQHSSARGSSSRKLRIALSELALRTNRQVLLQQASHTAQQRDHPHQQSQLLVGVSAQQEAGVAPVAAGAMLHTLHHQQYLQAASAQRNSSSAHAVRQQQSPAAG
jgi:hypothetical protein